MNKLCKNCNEEKDISLFSITKRRQSHIYYHNLCKACVNAKIREQKAKNLKRKCLEKINNNDQEFLKREVGLRNYTYKELAQLVGVPYGNLLYWIKSGKFN